VRGRRRGRPIRSVSAEGEQGGRDGRLVAVAGVVGIAPGRVDRLLGKPDPWRLPSSLVALALATIAALGAVLWLLVALGLRGGG
jgi:hypothetical protein